MLLPTFTVIVPAEVGRERTEYWWYDIGQNFRHIISIISVTDGISTCSNLMNLRLFFRKEVKQAQFQR